MNKPSETVIYLAISFYRSLAVGIVHGLDNTANCLTLKLFPSLVYWLSFSGTNYFFSAMSLVLTIWGWMAIKETDGLSLTEIEHIYDQRHRYRSYGEKQEGPGVGTSVSKQRYSEPESHLKLGANEPNSYSGAISNPD